VPEILVEAAERLVESRDIDAVVVLGPQYRGSPREPAGVRLIDALPTAALGALLADARLAVTGAGSMLSAQVLAAGVPAVMVPAGGNDQAQRIRDLERAGLVAGATLRPGELAASATALLDSPRRQESLLAQQRALGMVGATGRTAERLLALAGSGRGRD
jgi:UDP:flavonoid glycosyltransferase YjiC (YdhE family)